METTERRGQPIQLQTTSEHFNPQKKKRRKKTDFQSNNDACSRFYFSENDGFEANVSDEIEF